MNSNYTNYNNNGILIRYRAEHVENNYKRNSKHFSKPEKTQSSKQNNLQMYKLIDNETNSEEILNVGRNVFKTIL